MKKFITLTRVTTSGIRGSRDFTFVKREFRVRPEKIDGYYSHNVIINGQEFYVAEDLTELDELLTKKVDKTI